MRKFFYSAPHGAHPFLSPYFLAKIKLQAAALQIGDFISNQKVLVALQQKKISFKKFIGFPEEKQLLISCFLNKKSQIKGSSQNDTIRILSQKGFQPLTAERYWRLAQLINPQFVILPTQVPDCRVQGSQVSNKNTKRAIQKARVFYQTSASFKGKIFYPILLNSQETIRLTTQSVGEGIFGLALYGLGDIDSWPSKINILKQCLSGKQYQFFLPGSGSLQQVQVGSSLGINFFQVAQPFQQAKNGLAIVDKGILRPPVKEQLERLEEKCLCLCCRSYSQAYIRHLIDCKQITAQILLTLHNLSKYRQPTQ